MDGFEARPGDLLFMGNDPDNVFLVDVDLARSLASLGDKFEWTFKQGQYEPEVAARGPGGKQEIAVRFRAAKDLPSRERVAKEDLDPAVKAALGLTRTRRARRTGEAKDGGLRSWARRGRGCGRGSGSGRFIQRRCNGGRIIWLFWVGDFERLRRGGFSRRRRESRVEGSLDGWATTCCASRRERGRQSLRRREGARKRDVSVEEPFLPDHDRVLQEAWVQ